jgi:hypothetical protein
MVLDYVNAEYYGEYEKRREDMYKDSYMLTCLRAMAAANTEKPNEYPTFEEYYDMYSPRALKQDKPVDLKSGDDKWAETLKRIEERKKKI